MKVKNVEYIWDKISPTGCKLSNLNAPSTETLASHSLLGESLFLIFLSQYESQKGEKFMEQNQLNRLQMVQFECPKQCLIHFWVNPLFSFSSLWGNR